MLFLFPLTKTIHCICPLWLRFELSHERSAWLGISWAHTKLLSRNTQDSATEDVEHLSGLILVDLCFMYTFIYIIFLHLFFILNPVKFWECVWSQPAEPPLCDGADDPRGAALKGGTLSGLSRPCAPAQPSAPAGDVSTDGPYAAGPPPHQVPIKLYSLDSAHFYMSWFTLCSSSSCCSL